MNKVIFNNRCGQEIFVCINKKYNLILPANKESFFEIPQNEQIELVLRQRKETKLEKKSFRKTYRIAVETKYIVKSSEDEIRFDVAREVIRVNGNIYYEKIHLYSSQVQITMETNCLTNIDSITKKFIQSNRMYMLFISPLEHMTGLVLVALALSVVLGVKIGWGIAVGAFFLVYGLICIINYAITKSSNFFFKKIFHLDDDKAEFSLITSNEYVSEYFKNPNRKAYMNDRNIEGM